MNSQSKTAVPSHLKRVGERVDLITELPDEFIRATKKRVSLKPRKPLRLLGAFVTAVNPNVTGSVEVGHYFPTTMQASEFLGFKTDVVGVALRRAERENKNYGRAFISGIEFTSVRRAYEIAKEIELLGAHPILQRHFPWLFREDGYAISNPDEARRRRARLAKANATNLPVAAEEADCVVDARPHSAPPVSMLPARTDLGLSQK
jgi:hypothetical protein